MNDPCPDDRALHAFVRGALAPAALDALDRHLDQCDSCGELVASLAVSHERQAPSASAQREAPARHGRYEVRSLLGRGASGAVFLAWDPTLSREVALKIVRPERASDPVARERLLREASALAALSHPNVVTVFDVGLDDDAVFVAMEVVRGPSLRAVIESRARTQNELLAIIRAAGEGLAAAHERGLLHRDVKPDNIIVGDDRPRLVDFGLASSHEPAREPPSPAHSLTALTLSGTLLGTPLYMAPETLRGERATERSDLYSLAVTTYEALSGRRPFEASSIDALLDAIRRGPARIEGLDRSMNRSVNRALRDALSEDPSRRPRSVRAWLDAIAPARRTRPAAAIAASITAFSAAALLVGASVRSQRGSLDDRASRPTPECAQPLAPVVSEARRARWSPLFSAIDARVGPVAARLLSRTVERFDADSRASMSRSCQDTFSSHAQSLEAHSARAQCLIDARRALDAQLEGFDHPTRDAVVAATAFDDEAPSLSPCADARALLARAPRPEAPEQRAAIERAQREIVASIDAVIAGHFERAEGAARSAITHAQRSQWGPVEARALRALARASRARGRFDEAEQSARRAALVAESSRDDETAARAWLDVVSANGARGAWTETLRSIEQAEASVTRVGSLTLRSSLELLRALAATNLGRLDDALSALARCDDLRSRANGDRSPVLTARANVLRQQGRIDDALSLHREAMLLDEQRLGEDHPVTATHLHNIAGVLRRLDRTDAARESYQRALDIETRWLGATSLEAGLTMNSLGLLSLERGRLDEAQQWLDRARSVLRGRPEESLPELNLSLLASARGRFDEAIGAARQVIERDGRTFGPVHLRVARASKVLAVAYMGAHRASEARGALAAATSALGDARDAESVAVRDECAELTRKLNEPRATSTAARPRPRTTNATAPQTSAAAIPVTRDEPQRPTVTTTTEVARVVIADAGVAAPRPAFRPAPSGSGSYGPAQRW